MIHTDPVVAAPLLAEAFAQADRVLILSHINPDGDAIGSMLAMWHMLESEGKMPVALASPGMPGFVQVLPGIEHVLVYEQGMLLPETDLVCLVDASHMDRVGPIYDDHTATLASRPLVIIDHHVTTIGEGKINLIDSGSASCADLIYRLLRAMRAPITPEIATCLFLGLFTDTQSFQTSASNPAALRAAADMLEAGASQEDVVRAVSFSTPFTTLALLGLSLSHIQRDGGLVWTYISQDMMRSCGADDAASDVVTSTLQRVEGGLICALFKERQNGETKISLRSIPGIDVAAIARIWGGGGHQQAAGATLPMPLPAAQQEVLTVLRDKLKKASP